MRRPLSFLLFTLIALYVSTADVSNAFGTAILLSSSSSSRTSATSRRPSFRQRSECSFADLFLQKDENNDEKQIENPLQTPSMTKGTRPSINPILFNIDAAITFGAILFVLIGFVLNIFGYSYVVEDGHLRIDTLDYRQFHDEVVRAAKEANHRLSNLR
jgi:hypothetical protein